MFRFFKVSGDSLAPDIRKGDFVLIFKIPFLFGKIKPGDLVLFNHPKYGEMIKLVDHLGPLPGEIFVVGTHENSIDSRHFGPIGKDTLDGKVIWHIRKPSA